MDLTTLRTRLRSRRDDNSASASKLDGWINEALGLMYGHADWTWLRKDVHHDLRPSYTVCNPGGVPNTPLTVTCIKDRVNASLAGDVEAPIFGHTILANGRAFRIANVLSTTLIQLDQPWFDASGTYAATILNNELALPRGVKNVRSVVLNQSNTPWGLEGITSGDARGWDLTSSGRPLAYSLVRREPLPSPIVGPSPASGAAPGLTGDYLYWQSYWDPATGAESNLSPSAAVTGLTNDSVTITPTQRGDFWYRIYRSRASGTVPYFLTVMNAIGTVLSDDRADAVLGARANAEAGSNYVAFWPIPDDEYQVLLTAQLVGPTLAADDDEPLCPEEDIPILLDGAEYAMLGSVEEQGRGARAEQRFNAGLAKMAARDKADRSSLIYVGGGPRRRGRPHIVPFSAVE